MDYRQALTALDSLHHAYSVQGAADARDALLTHLSSIGCAAGNPDFSVRTYETFGIDESRELAQLATRKPLASVRSVCVVSTPAITIEAQQALLKTFEDPNAPITFFLIMPSVDTLLPTLRSRLQALSFPAAATESGTAHEFLSLSPSARLKYLEPMLKERSMGSIIEFLASLERALATNRAEGDARDGLRAVYRARKYATDKGALLKPLLEQIALLVP